MKQKLSNKMKKSGGFTLIEMLVVVAIIAILVAISIPMVNSSLNKAKVATDTANERAAKAAALIEFMTGSEVYDGQTTYYFDAVKGAVVKDAPESGYGQCKDHKGEYLEVKISGDGVIKLKWNNSPEDDLHNKAN